MASSLYRWSLYRFKSPYAPTALIGKDWVGMHMTERWGRDWGRYGGGYLIDPMATSEILMSGPGDLHTGKHVGGVVYIERRPNTMI